VSYMDHNRYRMPAKVGVSEWVPCVLAWVNRSVTSSSSSSSRTLYDLSDFQLVLLYDYCMWDFSGLSTADIQSIVNSEPEPDWNTYSSNGFHSPLDFWKSYECLLGDGDIDSFRDAYSSLLRSIPL
jgi:hypothetical protein